MRARAGLVGAAALAAAIAAPRAVRADEPPVKPTPIETVPRTPTLLDRPHTIAELEAGLLTLPTAPISAAQSGGNVPLAKQIFKGDTTMDIGVHLLYRANRNYAVGAVASFAPNPSSDSQYVSFSGSITRTHSRSYMFMGGEARYYALRARWIEGYVGLIGGVIIVGDRFSTAGEDVPAILGTREVTVRTEGFSFGVEAGGNYLFTDSLVFGFGLRANRWLLPNENLECSAIGDCPTLTGSVAAFEIGLTIGYRIPL